MIDNSPIIRLLITNHKLTINQAESAVRIADRQDQFGSSLLERARHLRYSDEEIAGLIWKKWNLEKEGASG